jgi:predicted RNA polymerase sigma factor
MQGRAERAATAPSQLPRRGPERGLEAAHAIAERERLAEYPFYAATLGELEVRCGRSARAREHFEAALTLTRNPSLDRARMAVCLRLLPAYAHTITLFSGVALRLARES